MRRILKPLIIIIAKIIGPYRCTRKIEWISKKYSYDKSEYVGAISWGLYGIGERMKKSEFEKIVYVEFEGNKFPTFSCWDSYLKGIYGDYMKIPSIEKRKIHDMDVYIIEKKEVV